MTRWKAALCALLMTLFCAACGADAPSAPDADFVPALDTDTACKLRVVGSYRNFESLEAEFDRFTAYYPNVACSYVCLDAYNATIVPALSGPDAPQIYYIAPWMADLKEYEPLFEAAEDLSDPTLGIDLSCIRDGLLYRDDAGRVPLVPVFASTYGMLVNEDIFETSGLPIPETYSELLSVCDALRQSGYESPVMGYNSGKGLFNSIAAPYFRASVRGDADAIRALNALEPSAGEYLRPTLELVEDFMRHGCVNLDLCDQLKDNYEAVILRFFEGDAPMVFAHGDLVSGTAKRESLSQAFMEHPFRYSFRPVPLTEKGGYFLNIVSISFGVNRHAQSLDMANEFMRFLVNADELNRMAKMKRLVTPSVDLSLDGVYAAFGEVPPEQVLYELEIPLLDPPIVQMRAAVQAVGRGEMSVEEAVRNFGTLKE